VNAVRTFLEEAIRIGEKLGKITRTRLVPKTNANIRKSLVLKISKISDNRKSEDLTELICSSTRLFRI